MKVYTYIIASLSIFILSLGLGLNVQAQSVESRAAAESGMEWYSMEEAQQKARETGKKVLVFGYADWCTYCLKMRKEVYPDSSLQQSIYEDFYPVQLNGESQEMVTFNGQQVKAVELARYLRLTSYPTHYFINGEGEVFLAQPGFLETGVFQPMVEYVGTDAWQDMDFSAFMKSREESD